MLTHMGKPTQLTKKKILVEGQGQGHEGHETLKTLKLQYLPHFF